MASIVILGAGMMGSAFAWPLVDRGHRVRLVGTHLDEAIIAELRRTGHHPKLDLALPEGIQAYPVSELAEALEGADGIVLGVSSAGVRWAARALSPLLAASQRRLPVALVSKGLEWSGQTLRVLPDVFRDELGKELLEGEPVGVLGPCIAGELARRVPTSVVFTSRVPSIAEAFAAWSRGPYYHVHTTEDVVGSEVCAALKNAFAMGMAFGAGIHERGGGKPGSLALHNYEAAVFAESIWEMQKVIRLLGGDAAHAAWLPGAGDLLVTCNGGRTGRFGHLLGLGLTPAEAVRRMQGATLECLEILSNLRSAIRHYTEGAVLAPGALPLAEHLAEVALDGAPIDMPFDRFFQP